jgi:hypothetical protein
MFMDQDNGDFQRRARKSDTAWSISFLNKDTRYRVAWEAHTERKGRGHNGRYCPEKVGELNERICAWVGRLNAVLISVVVIISEALPCLISFHFQYRVKARHCTRVSVVDDGIDTRFRGQYRRLSFPTLRLRYRSRQTRVGYLRKWLGASLFFCRNLAEPSREISKKLAL